MSGPVEIEVLSAIAQIPAEDWDSCAAPDSGRAQDPFTTHRFLAAFEASASVGPGTGWMPRHLIAREEGQLLGVMPLYLKGHSQGEYMFDHMFADAFTRAGGDYYPKLQGAVPFTPATGRRFLARPGAETRAQTALTQGALQLAAQQGLSSLHVTFCTEAEAQFGAAMGLLPRRGEQFHWCNAGYETFEDFLAALSSRKRKAIRKERSTALAAGGRVLELTGAQITPAHLDAFWGFYQDTGARKWGRPYLTRAFFDIARETLADDMLLYLYERDGVFEAGALNFIGRDTLFGRYWGASAHHPCLHFELCYYRAIDYAIRHKLARVEAGAQGAHKLARGYLPHPTYGLCWFANENFAQATAAYLKEERRAVEQEIEMVAAYGPFRQRTVEEQD